MQNQQFFPDEFITANVLNAQVNTNINNFQSLLLGRGLPGLISPTSLTFSLSGLSVGVTAPLPFQVVFGTGILSSAHGVINGADTQSYTASFSGVVPGAGFPAVTAYLVATYQQIQQNPVVFIGPPPGHPDFNPNYVPYTAFTQTTDSIDIFATVAPPDNNTSFELFRCTLASGATGLGTISTAYQEWASSLSDMPIQEWAAPGTLTPQTMNNILVGGTYTMPNASTYNSNLLSITCNTPSLVTITSSNSIFGYYGQGAAGISTIILAQGGSIDFEAINGGWQIIGGNPLGLGIPINVFPWTVPQGGTGLTSLPAHTVLLGEGTSPIGAAGPGSPGLPLIGQGASADPVFGAINLNSGAVTNILQIGNGGSGNNSYNPWGTLIYNGNTGTFTTVAPGGVGAPLVAQGGTTPPSYQALNLNLGPVSITGVLPVGFGGTGAASYSPFGTIVMNTNTGTFIGISPNVAGTSLISNGGSTLPSYQAVNLGNPSAIAGVLPISNGGTGEGGFTAWSTIVMDNFINTLAGVGPGSAGQVLTSNGGTLPSYQTLPNPQWLAEDFYYGSAGTFFLTVPSWAGYAQVKVWGAGGGGSGSDQSGAPSNTGASGGGGGFSYGTYGVTPAGTIVIVVGGGGAGAANGAQAGNGGGSSANGAGVSIASDGGGGGSSGPGAGGGGAGGALAFNGQSGQDLDGIIGSGGSLMFAVGGCAGGGGGLGGNINAAGVSHGPWGPGGGGGANFFVTNGQNGADGGVLVTFYSSVMPI